MKKAGLLGRLIFFGESVNGFVLAGVVGVPGRRIEDGLIQWGNMKEEKSWRC
jgi:hypothetical protein